MLILLHFCEILTNIFFWKYSNFESAQLFFKNLWKFCKFCHHFANFLSNNRQSPNYFSVVVNNRQRGLYRVRGPVTWADRAAGRLARSAGGEPAASESAYLRISASESAYIFGGLVLGCIKTKFCKKICIFQALQDLHPFAPLQTQNFSKKSVWKISNFRKNSAKYCKSLLCCKICKILPNFKIVS